MNEDTSREPNTIVHEEETPLNSAVGLGLVLGQLQRLNTRRPAPLPRRLRSSQQTLPVGAVVGAPFHPVNPGGGLAGSVRLARCTVGCGAPAQADAREVAPLCVAALRACPWLSDIDRARLSDERLAVRVALCGSCRERFAARRVREYVSSDVSLCTSYQS